MAEGNCTFSGKGVQYAVTVYVHLFLLTLLTLGLYLPWGWVRLLRLKSAHMTIHGQPVRFSGTGGRLFVLLLGYGFLTLLTFGLFAPWAICRILQWRMENTLVGERAGRFEGTGGALFVFYLVHLVLLPMLTLGIYTIYGTYRFYAWKEEHSRYGGERTSFGAGFWPFVKVVVVTWILNGLTLQLFTPWALCMIYRWQVSGLAVGDGPDVAHFPPVRTRIGVVLILLAIGLGLLLGLGALGAWVAKDHGAALMELLAPPPQRERPPAAPPGPHKELRMPVGSKPRPSKARPPRPSAPEPPPKPRREEKEELQKELRELNAFIEAHGETPEVLYNRGRVQAALGNPAAAEQDYTAVIGMDPSYADAFYNRGLLFLQRKDYQKAGADFQKVIELSPKSADAYCNRGGVFYLSGKGEAAVRMYTKALEITPKDAELYLNRALAYLVLGDSQKARSDFVKAARLGSKRAAAELQAMSENGEPPSTNSRR